MVVKLKGIVNGSHIELERDPGLPAGSEVSVSMEKSELSLEEKRARLKALAGVWKHDQKIQKVFEEIQKERERDFPREIDLNAAP